MYLLDSRGSFYPFTDFHLTQNGSREVLNVVLNYLLDYLRLLICRVQPRTILVVANLK